MDLGLKDKRAWITGGSQGIGLAIAESLLKEGATVVLSSRSEEKLAAAKKDLEKQYPGKVETIAIDMLDEKSITKAGELATRKPVDILIVNTGGPAAGMAMEISLADWDKGYQSLLRSSIQLTHIVAPAMSQRRWGRILNVTSTSARELIPKLPVSGAYRAGLSSWTKSVAKELGRNGILVNNLLPGPIRTERLAHLAEESPDFYRSMAERSAIGRIGEPEEIGDAAAFLCSARNAYITGTDVLVDGGATIAL